MNIIEEPDFSGSYGKAKAILSMPQNRMFLNLLNESLTNSDYKAFIKLANDLLEVPPVKSFLLIFKDQIGNNLTDQDLKQAIGSYFGYLFQNKYGMQKAGIKQIKYLGVTTATWFKN